MTVTDHITTVDPIPHGFEMTLDVDAVRIDRHAILGGHPSRVFRLSDPGAHTLDKLIEGPVHTAEGARLARRLSDAGVLHPTPPTAAAPTLTIVIPVFDGAGQLEACLHSLGQTFPVIVVDDGSRDPGALQRVCNWHAAHLIRRRTNGGPAAARTTGLLACTSDVVVLIDSDCLPTPVAINHLAAHLADPLVAAVAPRMTASGSRSVLDLGDRPALVCRGGRVSYLPTAVLAVRRSALTQVDGFDPMLRVGEDVDLVWRLIDAGWRVRYDPSVTVRHDEPSGVLGRARRRFRYGTSAGPLELRHPGRLRHLHLSQRTLPVAAAAAAGSPGLVGVALVMSAAQLVQHSRHAGVPTEQAAHHAVRDTAEVWTALGTWCSQLATPLLALALLRGGRRRRIVTAALLVAPAFRARSLTIITDNIAYGAGVWTGCLRAHTTGPLRVPIVHPPRTDRAQS